MKSGVSCCKPSHARKKQRSNGDYGLFPAVSCAAHRGPDWAESRYQYIRNAKIEDEALQIHLDKDLHESGKICTLMLHWQYESIGCGASPERTSLATNSLVTGKLTGKMRENGPIRVKFRLIATKYQYVKNKFPKKLTGKILPRTARGLAVIREKMRISI
ncbi:hypothetical protein [Falsihalocynthiibacter arcticus]|uniref:Uncharacterized protein n=1 Tax=Falsihalocynthiibacter arcticus TaxID=1579316 RepID=A0A126V0R2_9RHOB|nr:hypothetical protein [Falsihalocynthiibacter arcticus]AML51893.1 hypothetical protein RC74_12020 [Falsihalocynthiibacter arcticus]